MKYAVIALTGDIRGYIIKRAILAHQNRAFVGSLKECRSWIAGYQQALTDQETGATGPVTLTVVPWQVIERVS